MRNVLIVLISLIFSASAIAQIPYYAGTVGDGRMYINRKPCLWAVGSSL